MNYLSFESAKLEIDNYFAKLTKEDLALELKEAGVVAEVPCGEGLCPHCGYDIFSDCDPFGGCEEKGWYIICPDCVACGPVAETKIEAEKLFRKRA